MTSRFFLILILESGIIELNIKIDITDHTYENEKLFSNYDNDRTASNRLCNQLTYICVLFAFYSAHDSSEEKSEYRRGNWLYSYVTS